MPRPPRKRETKKLTCPYCGRVVKFTIPKIERLHDPAPCVWPCCKEPLSQETYDTLIMRVLAD